MKENIRKAIQLKYGRNKTILSRQYNNIMSLIINQAFLQIYLLNFFCLLLPSFKATDTSIGSICKSLSSTLLNK